MPERERPSLTGLSIKRPLAERGKPVVSFDEAETALLGDPAAGAGTAAAAATAAAPAPKPAAKAPAPAPAQAPVPAAPVSSPGLREDLLASLTTVQPTIQSTVLSPSLLKARRREIKIAWTFKIPHTLHQELSAVASHNNLTMSDIVIEAIRFHLPNFPHPPKRGTGE